MSYATLGATTTISSTSVKSIQTAINAVLQPQGYLPIAVDGKFGPLTCGALQATVQYDGGAVMQNVLGLTNNNIASVCSSYTPPKLAPGAPTPAPAPGGGQVIDLDQPQPGVTNLPAQSSGPLTSSRNIMIAGGVIVGGILLVYAHKKSKKPAHASA